ncbi:winged helix-turn-helix transcriptional regulator [Spirillospora sp. CA-294931]|uniref:winged helix-turn-helix transcriptional regulator n=1 Tax=Spirillospora sp. CA-294931 TaxID=3240042 RepID=UPI003D90FE96
MRSTGDVFLADCQARLGFDLLTGAWTSVVLYALREGPLRPADLRGQIGGISPKVLNETLRRLERNGLVSRRRYAEAPPRVEYELTAPGRGLLEPIAALGRWSQEHGEAVLRVQESNGVL